MTTIGYATLAIIPSLDGVSQSIDQQLGGALRVAGRRGGEQFSAGIAAGLKAAEADVKKSTEAIVKLKDKEADAIGKVRVAEANLQQARSSGNQARIVAAEEARERALRAQVTATRTLQDETRQLTRAQQNLADAQQQASSTAAGSGTDAGSGFFSGFAEKVKGLGGKGGPIGVALAAAATLGLGAGALLVKNFLAGMDKEAEQDVIQAKLGIDDSTMAGIAQAAGEAYAGDFGESIAGNMDAARIAIQQGLIPSDAGEAVTQGMIERLTVISSLMGEEIPAVSRAAAQAIRTGMAANAEEAFDLIVRGEQLGINKSEDLLDTFNEYGTQFRKLGLSGKESLGLMNQLIQAGAKDSDVAADALKEFSIRAVDGSKSSAEAFAAAGLNADEMQQRFIAGGQSAHDAFGETLAAINTIQDPVTRSTAILGLFGTQAEDIGAAFNNLDLSTAVAQLGEVDGAAQRASDTLGGNTKSSWESLKRTVEKVVDQIQRGLAKAFGPTLQDLVAKAKSHTAEIIQFFTDMGVNVLKGLDGFLAFGSGVTRVLGSIAQVTGRVFGALANLLGNWLKDVGTALEHVPFLSDLGKGIRDAGSALDDYGDIAFHSGDKLDDVADVIDNLRGVLPGATDAVQNFGNRLADSAKVSDALGASVAALKIDGNKIVINVEDNTPEVQAGLTKLDAHLAEIEGDPTHLEVIPNTTEAARALDTWRADQSKAAIQVPIKFDMDQAKATWAALQAGTFTGPVKIIVDPVQGFVPLPANARGGIDVWDRVASYAAGKLPSQAIIQPAREGLVQWAEPSTRGEAFIPLAGGARSEAIWLETGKRLGMLRGFDTGSINYGSLPPGKASETNLQIDTILLERAVSVLFPQIQSIGGWRAVDNYPDHPSGRAIDIMIPDWSTPAGKALGDQIAAWVLSNKDALNVEYLIWQQTYRPASGQPNVMEDRGSPTQNHMDHVHVTVKGKGKPTGSEAYQLPTGAAPFTTAGAPAAGAQASTEHIRAAPSLGRESSEAVPAAPADNSGSSSLSLPSSISGLSGFGFDSLGAEVGKTSSGSDLSLFGKAAGAAISGQVSSALDVFGVGDSPGWLKGLSMLIGGIKIGGSSPNSADAVAPIAAAPHEGTGAPPGPGDVDHHQPQTVYNITARDTEDAFIRAQRLERERAAAKLVRY